MQITRGLGNYVRTYVQKPRLVNYVLTPDCLIFVTHRKISSTWHYLRYIMLYSLKARDTWNIAIHYSNNITVKSGASAWAAKDNLVETLQQNVNRWLLLGKAPFWQRDQNTYVCAPLTKFKSYLLLMKCINPRWGTSWLFFHCAD